jgi:hypothetical protein
MNVYVRLIVSMAFAGLIASAAISGVRAQAPGQPDTYYGLTFPEEIGGGQRIEAVHDYETDHPGLGYSAGYRHRGANSTVYIYDLGLHRIPDDLQAPVVTLALADARAAIHRRTPGTVEDTGHFTIADSQQRTRLICEGAVIKNGMRGDDPGAPPIDTFVCLGVVNGKFFKVRTSMPQRPDSKAEARRFIGAWVARLW